MGEPLAPAASAAAAVFAVGVACACSCGCGGSTPGAAAHAPVTRAAAPGLTLVPAGGEVWAWQIDLGGQSEARLTSCRVSVGGIWADARTTERGWSARVRLSPGENVAFAECEDASGRLRRSEPSRFSERLPDAPRARITQSMDGDYLLLDGSASTASQGSNAPVTTFSWAADEGGRRGARALGSGVRVAVRRDLLKGAIVRLTVHDAAGGVDQAATEIADASHRSWLPQAIVYGVAPPFYGDPPLKAVTGALASLADLGATVVWMTPIFEAEADDFGYAVTDYFRMRRSFGEEADLTALLGEAHRLGLRVILDMVPNHTSSQHRYFVDTAARGASSRYYAFYERDERGSPKHYFDWTNLPNLDYRDAEVATWILEASAHWVKSFGIDGYRVDAAWGIRERAPGYWDLWIEEMRRLEPGAFLLAEGSARDPFYFAHGFDAAYDWSDAPGHWAWDSVFDRVEGLADRLAAALEETSARAGGGRVLRFLDNNDTGPRFVTRYGIGMTRVAAALLLTLPGIPCLFTGDETGAEYDPYRTQGTLPPGSAPGLRDWYRRLIALRRGHPSLSADGSWERARVVSADGSTAGAAFAYARKDPTGPESTLVVLNFGGQPASLAVALPPTLARSTSFRDLLDGATLRASANALPLRLPPWGVAVLSAR